MAFEIEEEVKRIYQKIEEAGWEVYFVGGCVRDLVAQKQVKDWDLATNAPPEEIEKLFPHSFYDNKFGTVGIPLPTLEETEHSEIVEVTTFRTEHGYTDRRRPDKVVWGKTIEEDLSRRDFTINAIALKLKATNSVIATPSEAEGEAISDSKGIATSPLAPRNDRLVAQ